VRLAGLQVLHSAFGVVRSPLFTTCESGHPSCLSAILQRIPNASVPLHENMYPFASFSNLLAVLLVINVRLALVAVIQVLSRLWAVWGVVHQAPEATTVGSVKLFKVGDQQLELSMYTLLFAWGVTEVLRYGFFAVKVDHRCSQALGGHLVAHIDSLQSPLGGVHVPLATQQKIIPGSMQSLLPFKVEGRGFQGKFILHAELMMHLYCLSTYHLDCWHFNGSSVPSIPHSPLEYPLLQ